MHMKKSLVNLVSVSALAVGICSLLHVKRNGAYLQQIMAYLGGY